MSIDPEDVRDELRNELIVLNADLKKLDRDLDYSDFIRTFLAGEGPAEAQIPRMKKQIQRMQKVKDDFLEKNRPNQRQLELLRDTILQPLPLQLALLCRNVLILIRLRVRLSPLSPQKSCQFGVH